MNINDLTDQQLNYLAAKAQGWDAVISGATPTCKSTFGIAKEPVSIYNPTHNGQQAFELMKKFKDIPWHEEWDAAFKNEWDKSPERAIVLAVVASKYGVDIDEGLLG